MLPANFKQSLARTIEKKMGKVIKAKAIEMRSRVMGEAKEWKLDVRGWLGRSHYARGKDDSPMTKTSGPYKVTGQLMNAVHYNTGKLKHNTANGRWSFTLYHSFGTAMRGSVDYSEILDTASNGKYPSGDRYYNEYKRRYTEDLTRRIEKIVRRARR